MSLTTRVDDAMARSQSLDSRLLDQAGRGTRNIRDSGHRPKGSVHYSVGKSHGTTTNVPHVMSMVRFSPAGALAIAEDA